jgi:hypothetical protein
MKRCWTCKQEKSLEAFGKEARSKDGHRGECFVCRKQYRIDNAEKLKEDKKQSHIRCKEKNNKRSMEWHYANPDHVAELGKLYRREHKEELAIKASARAKANRPKINAYMRVYNKKRLIVDPEYKLIKNLRNRQWHILKSQNLLKTSKILDLLGCSAHDWKLYLESKFMVGMSWDNYGYGDDKWNVDHIIPLTKFTLSNKEEYAKAFHFINTRPLWQPLNFSRGNRLDYSVPTSL